MKSKGCKEELLTLNQTNLPTASPSFATASRHFCARLQTTAAPRRPGRKLTMSFVVQAKVARRCLSEILQTLL